MAATGKSNAYENALLRFIFNGVITTGFEGIFGTPGSPLSSLYIALHTADPDDSASSQSVSECSYPGYARIALARDSSHFTITGNVVNPVANIDFPSCTSAYTQTATHLSIGTTASGSSGVILYAGLLTPTIAISQGVIPRLGTATSVSED